MGIYDQDESVPEIANLAVDNTEERTPCVLLIDCSGSMGGTPMKQVNAGLKEFERAIKSDPTTAARVVVCVIGFGFTGSEDVRIVEDWTEADLFNAPTLTAQGGTPMGKGMDMALDEVEKVKQSLRLNGITYKRPWVFLMTDGQPTDASWEKSADRCVAAIKAKQVLVWALTTAPNSADKLGRFVGPGNQVFNIEGADLSSMFVWLSSSLSAVSEGGAGESRQIPAPGPMITIET
ncbi:MAG: VWA domain-containing protein [Sphingomonas sp.]